MELGIDKEINIFENIEEVVICLRKRVGNNAVILFSPASTSFDQFKNFMVRGVAYKEFGGDPMIADDFAYAVRSFDWSGPDWVDENLTITKNPDLTS